LRNNHIVPKFKKKISKSYVDEHEKTFVKTLSEAVSIKSVSADPDLRNEVIKMMKWAEVKLIGLGATTELCDIGTQVIFCYNIFDSYKT